MKVSEYIALFIQKQGIDVVFEMAGGMITHMLDALSIHTDVKIISMHHEQAAAFAADGYGRATGLPGVAFATSGPGATNLLTGLGSCYFDSVPAVFITGQVNLHEQKGDKSIRQLGFQETDIVSMALPITKAAYSITDPTQIPIVFEKAFRLAVSGRPGPVLVDIPMNIQRVEIDVDEITPTQKDKIEYKDYSVDSINQVIDLLASASRPLVLAGGGVRASGAWKSFGEFIDKTNLPVITSLLGIDVIARDNQNCVGFIGAYGNRWANIAIGEADLLIVLGSRLDIRQTGADTEFFGKRKIIHIDCEIGEINNRVKDCYGIHADVNSFLEDIIRCVNERCFDKKYEKWADKLKQLKAKWPDTKELNVVSGINPNKFMHALSHNAQNVCAWLADVGNHQMWAAQSLEIAEGQRFITSGGMGAMGFALPAAIGVAFALDKPVVTISGDGGFQLNIQELQTIVRNNLPIKIVVLNNQNLGMIRQFQDSYFESRYQSTFWGYSAPNFEEIALAYKIDAKTIRDEIEFDEAIDWFLKDDTQLKPKLLQVMIDSHANAYPKIAFGKPLTEMEPQFAPVAMEST